MKQADVFREGEGDAWYERNKDKLPNPNSIIHDLIKKHVKTPEFIYEVGCADGWLLRQLQAFYGCKVGGIDPSRQAINTASQFIENVYYGNATKPVGAEGCNVLIYGFCLYLCDPEDYFRIVMEGDRVLKDGGYLIIHDFNALGAFPHRVPYKHKEGLFSHHVKFEDLWLAHPWYSRLENHYQDREAFTILKKDSSKAWWRNE